MTTGLATEEDEWSQFTLGDLCSLITDGKHGDSEDQSHSGFYFLSVKDILGNRLVYENARQITEVDFSETNRRTNLQPGDVLFTNTGTIGRIAIAGDDPRTYRTTFQKSVAILKPRRDLIDPRFLYYLLHFDNANLSEFAAGTTQKNLLLKDIRSFEVKVPPLREQRAIAHILGTLDDKIELNRRMSRTLEEMARVIFQDWFVDFGPTRAKMEGLDPYLPPELWDLFPDELVGSELGEIPEGWEVSTVSRLSETIYNGGTPKRFEPRYWEGGEIPWLTSGEVRQSFVLRTENFISQEGLAKSSAKMVPERSILVALYGATAGQVSMNYRTLSTNQAVSAIIPSVGSRYFCLVSLKLKIPDLRNRAVGSAQQNISKKAVESTIVLLPQIELRLVYDATVEHLFDQIFRNLDESHTLSAQRDMLLPKLVSGEIPVATR